MLAFLADGPSYGYEIKATFERAVGPEWGGLNIGHMYQILERLNRDGLVTSRVVAAGARPDRTVYRITAAGRRTLDAWLDEPITRAAGYRDEFILKLLAASLRSEQAVEQVCQAHRDVKMGELQTLRALRREHKDEPLAAVTIEAAILHVQADLKLVESVAANSAGALFAAFGASVSTQHREAGDSVGTRRTA